MGLDITAYRRLKPVPDAQCDEEGWPVDYDQFVRFGSGQNGPRASGEAGQRRSSWGL